MLLNEGDPIIIESPTYSGSLACLQAMGVQYVNAPTDDHGLIPEKLAAILDNWDASKVCFLCTSLLCSRVKL